MYTLLISYGKMCKYKLPDDGLAGIKQVKIKQGAIFMEAISVFIIKQTTLIQSNTTQVYFNSIGYFDMYATCFDLYLGPPQAF